VRSLTPGGAQAGPIWDARLRGEAIGQVAREDPGKALKYARLLAKRPELGEYAEVLLWDIREAHTTEVRLEALWLLRGLNCSPSAKVGQFAASS
jgi:hypothetical protein